MVRGALPQVKAAGPPSLERTVGVGDDGAVTPFLAPGVRLMSRLSYPRKFVLISLLFAIPLALMMYLWLREIGERIAFAEKERAGLEYVVALRQLLEPLERSRALALLAARDGAVERALQHRLEPRVAKCALLVDVAAYVEQLVLTDCLHDPLAVMVGANSPVGSEREEHRVFGYANVDAATQVRAGAGPSELPRVGNHSGAHGIQLDVADHR